MVTFITETRVFTSAVACVFALLHGRLLSLIAEVSVVWFTKKIAPIQYGFFLLATPLGSFTRVVNYANQRQIHCSAMFPPFQWVKEWGPVYYMCASVLTPTSLSPMGHCPFCWSSTALMWQIDGPPSQLKGFYVVVIAWMPGFILQKAALSCAYFPHTLVFLLKFAATGSPPNSILKSLHYLFWDLYMIWCFPIGYKTV